MDQIKLDLKSKIITGKKTCRLSIPCSEEFINRLDEQAERFGTERAKLAYQFVLEGMQKAFGEIFMAELRGDEKLQDLFNKG